MSLLLNYKKEVRKMATCGDCAYFMVEPADPMYGICGVDAKKGEQTYTIQGTRVPRRGDACDKFKDKKEMSREERLKRSY